ncbi:MAG: hypothetical protein ACJAY2_000753 [Pseudomonadales bacterium]|jgi:hypothetical protein
MIIDNTGERSVDAPICIFNQSNQTVTATAVNDTPGSISSALFDVSGDTLWVNYSNTLHCPGRCDNHWRSSQCFGSRTTFSTNGTTVAVPYIGKVEIYDATGRIQNTALAINQ